MAVTIDTYTLTATATATGSGGVSGSDTVIEEVTLTEPYDFTPFWIESAEGTNTDPTSYTIVRIGDLFRLTVNAYAPSDYIMEHIPPTPPEDCSTGADGGLGIAGYTETTATLTVTVTIYTARATGENLGIVTPIASTRDR
jgi:hypothetical protein